MNDRHSCIDGGPNRWCIPSGNLAITPTYSVRNWARYAYDRYDMRTSGSPSLFPHGYHQRGSLLALTSRKKTATLGSGSTLLLPSESLETTIVGGFILQCCSSDIQAAPCKGLSLLFELCRQCSSKSRTSVVTLGSDSMNHIFEPHPWWGHKNPAERAIDVSHAARKDVFRRDTRPHTRRFVTHTT